MNTVNKIKISKVAMRRMLTQKESSFLFSVLNKSGSADSAYSALKSWVSPNKENKIIVDGFTYDEHILYARSVLDKLNSNLIDIEDIEEIDA
jgi:hypothetical protein